MKTFSRYAALLLICFVAVPALAEDCSQVSSQIAAFKNKPKELRALLQDNPSCGEIWEALGDFFYERKVWNEAYTHYQEALKYSPAKKKLSARVHELGPKVTTLIRNEEELLAFRRAIGGVSKAAPNPPSEPSEQAPIVLASETRSRSAVPSVEPDSSRDTAPSVEAAPPKRTVPARQTAKPAPIKVAVKSKPAPSPDQSLQGTWTQADKIGVVVHFAYDSAELTPEGKKLLGEFAEMLNAEYAGKNFLIQGHTDNTGSREHNLWLSVARAHSVKVFLTGTGVSAARLDTKGYAFDRPIYDNGTEDGRAKNRRVEFETR